MIHPPKSILALALILAMLIAPASAQSRLGALAQALSYQKKSCEDEVGLFKAGEPEKPREMKVARNYNHAQALYNAWIERIKIDIEDNDFKSLKPYDSDLKQALHAVNEFKKAANDPNKGDRLSLVDVSEAVKSLSDSIFKTAQLIINEQRQYKDKRTQLLDTYKWKDYSAIPATKF